MNLVRRAKSTFVRYISRWLTSQPINGDSLGRRREEMGGIWGDGTTDKGQGGGDLVETLELHKIASKPTSEVQSKMIFMGHQISSCHVPVVRSFFIL